MSMRTPAVSCAEDSISQHFSVSLGSYILSALSSTMCLEPWRGAQADDVDVSFSAVPLSGH